MDKYWIMLIIGLLILSTVLVGCSKQSANGKNNTSNNKINCGDISPYGRNECCLVNHLGNTWDGIRCITIPQHPAHS